MGIELLPFDNEHDVAVLASFENREEFGGHRVWRHVDTTLRRFEAPDFCVVTDFELDLHRERVVLDPLGAEKLLV